MTPSMKRSIVGLTLDDVIALQREADAGAVHVVATDEQGFHLAHTDAERAAGENTEECRFHQWLTEYGPPKVEPGVYAMVRHLPDAYSEPYGADPFDLFPWADLFQWEEEWNE